MNTLITAAQIAVVGGVGGFITEVIRSVAYRKKVNADIEKSGVDADVAVTQAVLSLLEPARDQVQFLHRELIEARAEVSLLREQLEVLDKKLRAANHALAVIRNGYGDHDSSGP